MKDAGRPVKTEPRLTDAECKAVVESSLKRGWVRFPHPNAAFTESVMNRKYDKRRSTYEPPK